MSSVTACVSRYTPPAMTSATTSGMSRRADEGRCRPGTNGATSAIVCDSDSGAEPTQTRGARVTVARRGQAATMSRRHPRVVIVGGGHNGLACACRLAERGLEVTVLEESDALGGGVRSGEFVQAGFVHDHCAGFMPVALASPAMRAMRLGDYGVSWITPEAVVAHPFPD